MKNKTTAAILAFFLGGLGVHRFYLGQNGLGLVYLLFFWTFIPALIALVDFIIFVTMNDAHFNAKYNSLNAGNHPQNINTADELERLFTLKEKGIITEAEFQHRKAKLL